jgi:hypothetical protein
MPNTIRPWGPLSRCSSRAEPISSFSQQAHIRESNTPAPFPAAPAATALHHLETHPPPRSFPCHPQRQHRLISALPLVRRLGPAFPALDHRRIEDIAAPTSTRRSRTAASDPDSPRATRSSITVAFFRGAFADRQHMFVAFGAHTHGADHDARPTSIIADQKINFAAICITLAVFAVLKTCPSVLGSAMSALGTA